jgi:hypothetical protein
VYDFLRSRATEKRRLQRIEGWNFEPTSSLNSDSNLAQDHFYFEDIFRASPKSKRFLQKYKPFARSDLLKSKWISLNFNFFLSGLIISVMG